MALLENRRDGAEADEDGGEGREKYEIDSMGKPLSTRRKEIPCGETQGTVAEIF